MSGMGVSLDYNRLYVKYDKALKIKEKASEENEGTTAMFRGVTNSSSGIDEVVLKVDDPANVDEVLEFAKTTNIDFEKFKVDANTEEYEQMIGPLENVASFAKILVVIVAIARALASDTDVILADEPTGNLDKNNAKEIINILKDLAKKQGKCVIVVTYSNQVSEMSDVVLQIDEGKLKKI